MEESVSQLIKSQIQFSSGFTHRAFLPWVFFVFNYEIQSLNLNTGEHAVYCKFPNKTDLYGIVVTAKYVTGA
jgi:hypothetical protein